MLFAVLHFICCGVPLLLLSGVSLAYIAPYWPVAAGVLALLGVVGFVWYLKCGCATRLGPGAPRPVSQICPAERNRNPGIGRRRAEALQARTRRVTPLPRTGRVSTRCRRVDQVGRRQFARDRYALFGASAAGGLSENRAAAATLFRGSQEVVAGRGRKGVEVVAGLSRRAPCARPSLAAHTLLGAPKAAISFTKGLSMPQDSGGTSAR